MLKQAALMEEVTPRVFANTKLRGCNPSFVTTSDGVVVIDTPQLPTRAVAMRALAESHGPIRYLINTEHHVDHIFGNYYFKGAGQVVHHQGVYDRFMVVFPDLDPFAYANQTVRLRGWIERVGRRAEIELATPAQVEIMETPDAAGDRKKQASP